MRGGVWWEREMGNEAVCTMKVGKQKSSGKALLETAELIFRPSEGGARVKIPFTAIKSVKAVDGELHVETADAKAVFVLGAAAEKWREKILHPKTRKEKLGVKAGISVALLGEFDEEFLRELRGATTNVEERKIGAGNELIFLSANVKKELGEVSKVAKVIKGATGLWIVYPKGKTEITEIDVISAGRKAGLKDVKVCGFSATHTALKFVLPVAKR
jgi:hypothetical protein